MAADTIAHAPAPGTPTRRGERKMALWLRHSLCEAHDTVLSEGIPASWLDMIDEKLPRA